VSSNKPHPRFNNDELYVMLVNFKEDMTDIVNGFTNELKDLRIEMTRTTTVIRDYNNLREDIMELQKKVAADSITKADIDQMKDEIGQLKIDVAKIASSEDVEEKISHNYKGYIIGGAGVLFAFLSFLWAITKTGG
jgi:uncharacterized protein YdcH (DUF465 family)